MKAIADNANLVGYTVADKIVGKAAAMLLVKLGVSAVYGEVASVGGVEFLRAHGVEVSYGSLVPYIVNRDKRVVARWNKPSRMQPTWKWATVCWRKLAKYCKSAIPISRRIYSSTLVRKK